MADIVELARAKLNLCLHVTGRREDGYHLLDSLVVFPLIGDRLTFRPASRTTLTIDGPFADGLSATDNLVLTAAARLGVEADIHLTKMLPVASGIGGGSADAAATVRGLCRLARLPVPAVETLVDLGADIPVCLSQTRARMQGIGEVLSPARFPACACVLVNPGVAVPTGPVFAALKSADNPAMPDLPILSDFDAAIRYLRNCRNDLQSAAEAIASPTTQVLSALSGLPGCALARMSGSGATCFGLFADIASAQAAADTLRHTNPEWWIEPAPL